jgi:membrane fusion protein, multidrug efflux system
MKTKSLLTRAPFLSLLGLAGLCGCQPSATGPGKPPAPVVVQTVLPHRGEIARRVVLPAYQILPYQEATLYAKVSGYLKSLDVDKGDRVQAGQLLGQIEVPELLADEAQFQAEAEVAATNYARLVAARKRAPDLVVPQTVDDLWGQWKVAQAKLRRTRTLLQYARLTAPFAGVITARFVDPGAFIPAASSGTPAQNAALLKLMDFSRLRVQVFVPEPEVPFIKQGLPAEITVDELPGRLFRGSVTRFAYALDQATKTMLTEIVLPNPTGDLRPGMYGSVQLEVEHKPAALLVPASAVSVEKAGSFAFRVVNGKAQRTPIHTGFSDGVNVEITGGLPADQPVIVLGGSPLSDGEPVKPVASK